MSQQENNAIIVKNVSKIFKLPAERNHSIKSMIINALKKKTYEEQIVIKNISFEVKKGEFFGIVGRNGSGKSTILKLLAGIYTPNKGSIKIEGKLTPFIELGVGFNPELTGRENVYLNGALLGFNRKEMSAMYDEIVEFAELEKFMEQRLKNYSSGMQVRLAFSIAIRAESDILILDEVLAVGDANFQKKCYDVFKRFRSEGKTVVLVTHDMGAVEQYCTRAILLEDGIIKEMGVPYKVTKRYNNINIDKDDKKAKKTKRAEAVSKKLEIKDIWIDKKGKRTNALTSEDNVIVKVAVKARKNIDHPVVGVTLLDQIGKPLFATNTSVKKIRSSFKKNEQKIYTFNIKNTFSDGNYYIVPALTDAQTEETYDSIDEGHLFSISGWEYPAFVLQPEYSIKVEEK